MNAQMARVKSRRGRADLPAVLALLLLLLHGATSGAQTARPGEPRTPWVQAFDLISEDEGWLLSGGRLYWTTSGGREWREITPAGLERSSVQAVTFIDSRQGWMIGAQEGQDDSASYTLARTSDGGRTWRTGPPALSEAGAAEPMPGAVFLFFLDAKTGWLVVRQASSSNFRVGSLFRTGDGGDSWTRQSMPIGEPVYFVTREVGWTAGGAAGGELYVTRDGGQSWEPQAPGGPQKLVYLPRFDGPETGTLPVITLGDGAAQLELYATSDGGRSWKPAASAQLEPAVTPGQAVVLSAVDAHTWLAAVSGSTQLVRVADNGRVDAVSSGDAGVAGMVALDMATAEAGWARSLAGRCDCPAQEGDGSQDASGPTNCRQSDSLLRTEDGGKSWSALSLPEAGSSTATGGAVEAPTPGEAPGTASRTRWYVGQGFDKCEAATLSQLQTWKAESPYGAVNLYIGGSCRACANSGLTAEYVAQITQQGWRLIPTWVGPQSACSSSSCDDPISDDPAIAYTQGITEADAAVEVAIDLGLALPDGSGTIVYLDLEYYTDDPDDPTCRESAKAFISGWSGRLRERGSLAGLYTTCGFMSKYWTIENVPDAIWPARWLYTYYNPDASPWNLACMDNSLWPGHQRILQYTGGHYETWGEVALNIDCNVSDGIVAWLGGGDCCFCTKGRVCGEQSTALPWDTFRGLSAGYDLAPAQGQTQPAAADEPAAAGAKPVQREPVDAQRIPPASESYRMAKSVVGSGGGARSSASFVMNSTLGQSTDLIRRESEGYVLIPGYWGRWYAVVRLELYLPLVVKDFGF
jgi:photosystem II stability/assembly factor-like uncharacterized protein